MVSRTVSLAASVAILLSAVSPGFAQSNPPTIDRMSTGNVSSTGRHMPAVGASKSDGVTPLDRQVEQKMRKDSSICKGC